MDYRSGGMSNKSVNHPRISDLVRMKYEMDRLWRSISCEKTGKKREEAWELNPSPGVDVSLKWQANPFRRYFTDN
jgi:hypothetical protein